MNNDTTTANIEKNILIISCDCTFSDTVKMRLKANGYHAKAALESQLSNKLINSFKPDLLLYDLNNEQGNEVHQLIEDYELNSLNKIKTIYFGTKQDAKYKWSALSKGLAGFIEKPYQSDELLSQVENALLTETCNH